MKGPLRPCRRRGNAMVEFALAASLLIPGLLGMFQFGYSFFMYNRLVAAIRQGARYASVLTYQSASSTPPAAYLTAVRNTVVYGDPAGGSEPVVPGLTTSNISVQMTMVEGVPDMVTVSLNSFSVDAVVKTLTFTTKPEASFRFEGRFAPP